MTDREPRSLGVNYFKDDPKLSAWLAANRIDALAEQRERSEADRKRRKAARDGRRPKGKPETHRKRGT